MSAPVFADLVGQEHVIRQLERAIHSSPEDSGQEMSHAWLFTGPPGSGRSNIAKSFAAALICQEKGCGSCEACKTALAGSHPDVELVDVSGLSIKIDEIREIVARSSWGASTSNWRVVVIEDCDRMTEAAANALLKALEEPGASMIWLLCAPTLHDVLPTIRSRCRHLSLKTPTTSEITGYLVEKLDVSDDQARLAAEISQGHIGKAVRLIQISESKNLRKKTFSILFSIKSEKDAIRASAQLIELAQEQVELRTAASIEKEMDELKVMMQNGSKGMLSGGARAVRELERDQKTKSNRAIKDELDGYLLEYVSFFRDCLTSEGLWINSDLSKETFTHFKQIPPESISAMLTKLSEIRERLATNTSQPLLLEALFTFFALHNRGNQHPIL